MLEAIISPLTAEKKPWDMFWIGLLYSIVAMALSFFVFRDQASLVFVFLIVIACVPIVYTTLKMEEKKDITIASEESILKEHGKALAFFMFLFLGITVAVALMYIFVPIEWLQDMFSVQMDTLSQIRSFTGAAIQGHTFWSIFLNNVKVLVFCILFAFLYGTGAIFILTWNASVIGVAIGLFIRGQLSNIAAMAGLAAAAGYFHIFSFGFLKYAVHGIPEILAYFVGGLAGGIISIAVIRHDITSKNFSKILLDSSDLILASIGLLIVAALLEVYVTPVIFH